MSASFRHIPSRWIDSLLLLPQNLDRLVFSPKLETITSLFSFYRPGHHVPCHQEPIPPVTINIYNTKTRPNGSWMAALWLTSMPHTHTHTPSHQLSSSGCVLLDQETFESWSRWSWWKSQSAKHKLTSQEVPCHVCCLECIVHKSMLKKWSMRDENKCCFVVFVIMWRENPDWVINLMNFLHAGLSSCRPSSCLSLCQDFKTAFIPTKKINKSQKFHKKIKSVWISFFTW